MRWRNTDSIAHNLVADTAALPEFLTTGTLAPGGERTFTMTTLGTTTFHYKEHPRDDRYADRAGKVMPGPGGRVVYEYAEATRRGHRPHQPVLYLSRYTQVEIKRAGLPQDAPLVRKLLSGDDLRLGVRAAINTGG
jgi:hypothetical protein